MTSSEASTVLIVGASRGLGLGLVRRHLERGWRVIATVRGRSEALDALAAEADGRLAVETLDVTEPEQIAALAERLSGTRLDLLFVNAGVTHNPAQPIGEMSEGEFMHVLRSNAYGPIRVVERLGELVTAGGTVAVMTSGLGSVANNESGGLEAYRASKAALNTMLRSLAVRKGDRRICYLAVDPGWVLTDMGGPEAPLDVDTSTRGIADMLEARRGQAGVAFVTHENKVVPW